MKKRFLSILLALVCLCSFLPACGCGGEGSIPDVSVKAELNEAVMDLSNATNLAIVKRKDVTKKESTVKTMSSGLTPVTPKQIEEALVLATIRENQLIEEITFKREGEANFVTQDALGVEVYKMKVIGDYTFFSFISSSVRESLATQEYYQYIEVNENHAEQLYFSAFGYSDTTSDIIRVLNSGPAFLFGVLPKVFKVLTTDGEFVETSSYYAESYDKEYILDRTKGVPGDFDEIDYRSNDIMQSYVVYNKTGKVYSLDKFPTFDVYSESLIKANDSYYQYWVDENNDLVVEDVMPNKDVEIYDITGDPYGWVYIENEEFNERDETKKRVYTTGSISYMKDTNGYLYTTGKDSEFGWDFPLKKMVNGQEAEIDTPTISGKDGDWFMKDWLFVRGYSRVTDTENYDPHFVPLDPYIKKTTLYYSQISCNRFLDLSAENEQDRRICINTTSGRDNEDWEQSRVDMIAVSGEWWLGANEDFEWKYELDNIHDSIKLLKYDWNVIKTNAVYNEEKGVKEYTFGKEDVIVIETEGMSFYESHGKRYYMGEDSYLECGIETLIFKKENFDNNEYYTLALNEETGKPEWALYSEETFEQVYYVIQPLN